MPAEILLNSCNFYNQLKSGYGFSTPTDPTYNLTGSVAERLKCEMEVMVSWYYKPTVQDNVVVSGTGTVFQRTVGSFITDDSFAVGDTVAIYAYAACTGVIASLNDLIMTITITSGTPVPDGTYSSPPNPTLVISGTTLLTALIFKFGLIGNADVFNVLSKVSNNEQAFYVAGIDHAGSPPPTSNMLSLGNYKDWVSGSGDVITNTCTTVAYQTTTYTSYIYWQRFKITHLFIIAPWYLEQWITNFTDNTIPSILAGLQSLKYVFECEFRTVLSNPNTSKTARVENNLGSIGWFNENYNGFNNLYEIESVTYQDSTLLSSCDGLQIGSRTTATITINKLSGNFNNGDICGVIVSLCPESSEYINTITSNLEGNYLYDDLICVEGAGSTSGSYNNIIKNIIAAKSSPTQLVIDVQIEYTAAQQIKIPLGSKFILGAIVADDNLTSGNSDKVMLLADYNDYVASADIPDLMYVTGFESFQHFVTDPTATTGTTKADLWNEDGLCFKFDFWLDLAKNALLNSLKFLVIAYDSTTGNYFILNQYAINLNSVIISGGVQQINISDTRGYKLNTSDYFNKVVIATGSNIANKQYYQMYIGQKTPWQDWISNIDVDTIFYDNTKPQNNLNYKSSNYSNLNNYQIKFALLANVYGTNVLGISGNTDYLIITPDFLTYDYDLPVTWVATIETFDETGTNNLGGVIRTDADTLFRITWVRDSAFNVGYNFWAIHRIEEADESGYDIYEFSSIISSIANNKLKPVSGQTFLKVDVTPLTNTVVTECLIDYTKLDPSKSYKISGRLDDGTAVPYVPVGKLTEEDTLKITEDGQVKIIE